LPSATLTRVVLGRLCPPVELFPDYSALETSPPLPREGTWRDARWRPRRALNGSTREPAPQLSIP